MATHGRYAYSTLAEYAAIARVASKAIEGYLATLPPLPADAKTLRQCQQELDAPYAAELRVLGLMQPGCGAADYAAAAQIVSKSVAGYLTDSKRSRQQQREAESA